ncbi:MAG TPA: DivIVA domain-containing protein [Gaiellaceae bacterium]|nr:DivIVA domain-containing protein [Gaiellaceae bacterium]
MTHDAHKRLEPPEIQHARLRRRPFGYRRGDVEELLETVTASFEEVWYEREALRERVEQLLDEGERRRDRDRLVGDVVRNAQRVADETLAEARETADRLLAKARRKADELLLAAEREPERLREDLRALAVAENTLHERVRALLARGGATADEPVDDEREPEREPLRPVR